MCLGANERQVFVHVVIPAVVPNIVTGMKIAMGNSFMTVVSAEMVAVARVADRGEVQRVVLNALSKRIATCRLASPDARGSLVAP